MLKLLQWTYITQRQLEFVRRRIIMAYSVSEDDIRQVLGVKIVKKLLKHLSSLENVLFLDDDDMKRMKLSVDCKTAIRKLKWVRRRTSLYFRICVQYRLHNVMSFLFQKFQSQDNNQPGSSSEIQSTPRVSHP